MTDRSKFEQMLEYLISEEQDKAREVFHQLVVEKSREIYESILAEELEEEKEEDDEEVDEGMQVTFSETDDEEDEMGDMDPMGGMDDGEVGGDATDDFMGDIDADGGDEMDMDGGEGEGDLEDRVMDLEDALDDLRAEFETMMGDEGGEEMDMGDEEGEEEPDFGADDEEADDEGEEEADDEEEEVKDSFDATAFMREYIEKVSGGHGPEKSEKGDNGTNTKSIIDNMKNDMGGTTANFARGGEPGGKGVASGLAKPTTKEENFGNINVPGGNAGKTAFKKKEPGHGAERKGSGDMGDKSAGSPINGAPKRAK
jgi:hypothetical protein